MSDPTYDETRSRKLIELLRGLAERISGLTSDDALLAAGPELLKLMGDARSELFHYEVRSTYDTPEIAEGRRIVEEAQRGMEAVEYGDGRFEPEDEEGDEQWRSR